MGEPTSVVREEEFSKVARHDSRDRRGAGLEIYGLFIYCSDSHHTHGRTSYSSTVANLSLKCAPVPPSLVVGSLVLNSLAGEAA